MKKHGGQIQEIRMLDVFVCQAINVSEQEPADDNKHPMGKKEPGSGSNVAASKKKAKRKNDPAPQQ